MTQDDFGITVLQHEEEPIGDSNVLTMLLGTILKSGFDSSSITQLKDALIQKGVLGMPFEAASIELGSLLVQRLTSEGVLNKPILQGLLDLASHLERVHANKTVYVKDGRENQNAVFWPNPTRPNESRSMYGEEIWAKQYKLIDKSTRISSGGSCFASEIAYRLQEDGYNYVLTENYRHPNQPGDIRPASAAWGGIYNAPSFVQLIEKAFEIKELPKIAWKMKYRDEMVFADPFREDFNYPTLEAFADDYDKHRKAAREAFLQSDVFCMTLGLIETWQLRDGGAFLPRYPGGFAASLVERKLLSVEDNLMYLQRMLDVLRVHNEKLKIIITVSPVPLSATFRSDSHHVIAATCHSKSVLRVAVEEFVKRNKDVFYFPSFETVMYTSKSAWQEDERHVSKETVDRIMRLFHKVFMK